jgi:hypothetical protein
MSPNRCARTARGVLAGAVPFLELAGIVFGGGQFPRSAPLRKRIAAGHGDTDFLRAKIATARHFADHFSPRPPV